MNAFPVTPREPWLLAGPPSRLGPEPLGDHLQRLGQLPDRQDVVTMLREGRVRGRGGARFPAWRKWEAVASRSGGQAVVVVNGAEGEPASAKDRLLMATRPHLVLDGALIAARAVGAHEVVVCVNREYADARTAMAAATSERWPLLRRPPRVRLVETPPRYVAGEETALVHLLNGGPAKPTFSPRRPFESGVRHHPTLVHNVETLAVIALLARFGPGWLRTAGTEASPGTLLTTISGAVARPGVYEVPHGTPLPRVIDLAGPVAAFPAVLVGGCFGTWLPAKRAAGLALDDSLATAGGRLGCGAIFVLAPDACGLMETARILAFLAQESAGQCGPCREGLPALAAAAHRLATGPGRRAELERLRRWAGQLSGGRGACRHPDGAAGLVASALDTFAGEVADHLRRGPCRGRDLLAWLPPRRPSEGWR